MQPFVWRHQRHLDTLSIGQIGSEAPEMRDERVRLLNPGVSGTPEVHNDVRASTSRGSESLLGAAEAEGSPRAPQQGRADRSDRVACQT